MKRHIILKRPDYPAPVKGQKKSEEQAIINQMVAKNLADFKKALKTLPIKTTIVSQHDEFFPDQPGVVLEFDDKLIDQFYEAVRDIPSVGTIDFILPK
jgi:hypothetical protein